VALHPSGVLIIGGGFGRVRFRDDAAMFGGDRAVRLAQGECG